MTDEELPKQPYKWLTNLRFPFSTTDQAYLDKLADYQIGAPQVAKNRDTAYTAEQLRDFNIIGVYVTERTFRAADPKKITQDMAKKALGVKHQPLDSHLTKYLDADFHLQSR